MKLITLLGKVFGINAFITIFKKFFLKSKKIKNQIKGTKKLFNNFKLTKNDSSNLSIEFKKNDYEKIIKDILINNTKQAKSSKLIIFNGTYEQMKNNFKYDEDSFIKLQGLYILNTATNMNFIFCCSDNTPLISQYIKQLKKIIIKLYKESFINLPTIQLYIVSNDFIEIFYNYLNELLSYKLFKNLPIEINSLNIDINNSKIKNFPKKFFVHNDHNMYTSLLDIQKQINNHYIYLTFENFENKYSLHNEFHILNQAIENSKKYQDQIQLIQNIIPYRKVICFNLINKDINYTNNYYSSIYFKHFIFSILGISSIYVSVMLIKNHLTISQNKIMSNEIVKYIQENESLKELETFYNKTKNKLNHSLSFNQLYPNNMTDEFNGEIYKQSYNILFSSLDKKSSLEKLALTLLFASYEQPLLKKIIKDNIDRWANILEIRPAFMSLLLQNSNKIPIPLININVEEIEAIIQKKGASFDKPEFINKLIKQNKSMINIEQLISILNQQHKDVVIIKLLKEAFPLVTKSFLHKKGWDNAKWWDSTNEILKSFKLKHNNNEHVYNDLLHFLGNITSEDSIDSFSDIISQLNKTNDLIINNSNKTVKSYTSVILQAYFNSIVLDLFEKRDTLPLLPENLYYQNITLFSFDRKQFHVPVVYTKASINEYLEPLSQDYDNLINTYSKYNINHDLLTNLFTAQKEIYLTEYVKTHNDTLEQALPKQIVKDSDISLFLLDISSKQSPLHNILKFVSNNTKIDIPTISDKFKSFNEFIHSDDFINYQNQFQSYSKALINPNIKSLIKLTKEIGSKDENMISKVKDILKKADIPDYQVDHFVNPTQIIKNYLFKQASTLIKREWDLSIKSRYSNLMSCFPFKINSEKVISNEKIRELISKDGTLFNDMKKLLAPFTIKSSQNYEWKFKKQVPEASKKYLEKFLKQFNKINLWQNSLWDNQGMPKEIIFKIKGGKIESKNLNIPVIASFISSNGKKVTALNTNENKLSTIEYNWYDQNSLSVGWIGEENQIYQKNFSGEWAFFKALKTTQKNKNSYRFDIDINNIESAQIEFEIKSDITNGKTYDI